MFIIKNRAKRARKLISSYSRNTVTKKLFEYLDENKGRTNQHCRQIFLYSTATGITGRQNTVGIFNKNFTI